MPKWLDEVNAIPDENPRKKVAMVVLVIVAIAVVAWRMSPQAQTTGPPPPTSDVYRSAVAEIASASYSGTRLELTVDKRWNRLAREAQSEKIVALLELTGSFEYDRITIRDTDAILRATVAADGTINWADNPR